MARILVVGGGISGLAAAHRLAREASAPEARLVEKSGRIGGKVGTLKVDGFLLDNGPESFLTRKPWGVELCRELGIAGRLIGRSRRSGGSFIYRRGRLHPLPEGFSGLVPSDASAFEASELLSAEGKRRLLAERSAAPRPAGVGEESVAQFMTRRFGAEAFEAMIEPLLCGIFAGDARLLSIDAAFPQLVERERLAGMLGGARESRRPRPDRGATEGEPAAPAGEAPAARREAAESLPAFASFPNGMGELVEALAAELPERMVVTGASVREVRRRGRGFSVALADGAVEEVDAVILATPPAESARLLGPIDARLEGAHAAVPAASTVVVHLGFRSRAADLDGYGYLVPSAEGRSFHGCTWSSSKWPGRAPEGCMLLRLYGGRYGAPGPAAEQPEEIFEAARAEVAEVLGITEAPVLQRLVRWTEGIPQYNLGHHERLETIAEALAETPGLFLSGAAYGGIGLPDCIRSGRQAAEAAIEYLTRS